MKKEIIEIKNDAANYKALVLTRRFHGKILGHINPYTVSSYPIETTFVTTPVGLTAWNIPMRFLHFIGYDLTKYFFRRDTKFNKWVLKWCKENNPDIVYVVQGIQLFPETIEELKKKSYVICSLCDRLSLFPQLEDIVGHYEALYTYSKEDAEILNDKGIRCIYVPSGTNKKIYYAKKLKRDIEVSFVGVMYDDRRDILTKLVQDLPQYNFVIYGKYSSYFDIKRMIKLLRNKRLRTCFKNHEISEEEACNIYNRSKICLNLNRDNAGNSWAARFANIASTKSFQLMTYNVLAEEQFGDSMGLFKSYEDLKEKINYYLEHDEKREEMAELCYNKYFVNNSRLNVFQEILDNAARKMKNI